MKIIGQNLSKILFVSCLAILLTGCGSSSSNSTGGGNPSNPTASPAEAPGLSISTVFSNSATIQWAAIADASRYEIFRATNSDLTDSMQISSSVTATNYTDNGLNGDTTYYYTAKACNTLGCSSTSSFLFIQTLPSPLSPPQQPPTLNLTGIIAMEWAKITSATYYIVSRSVHSDLSNPVDSGRLTALRYVDNNNLSPSTMYYYTIKACNSGGCSSASAPVTVRTNTVLSLSYSRTKNLHLHWQHQTSVSFYLIQKDNADSTFNTLSTLTAISTGSYTVQTPLHKEFNNTYRLVSCISADSCTNSNIVQVNVGNLVNAVGYFKASNSSLFDNFGWSVSISGDGNTLAIGSINEQSTATGINGNQTNSAIDQAAASGAVYLFSRNNTAWSQQAYIKASNTKVGDQFGYSVNLSDDGNTLAVSSYLEDSSATGVNGNQNSTASANSGAVYVFSRSSTTWSQQAYIKASNTETDDHFGVSISLSGDGNTLAVGANQEDSASTATNNDSTNNRAIGSGAVYVFSRSSTTWNQQAYVKASNTKAGDQFGYSVSLNNDGSILAVGAHLEDSDATGVNGNQTNTASANSGAVYVFSRSSTTWSQQAYVKASNTKTGDQFGYSVSLDDDANTLAVGANLEDSSATGVNGNQNSTASTNSGAVYVFNRSGVTWNQQAYVKASNTEMEDQFGVSISLSGDGNTLAVGAHLEDSNASSINSTQSDNTIQNSGAIYVFELSSTTVWIQNAYVKASNTNAGDNFGYSVSLSSNGNTLAAGAHLEDSSASGINGNQGDNATQNSGAVYLY